MAKYKFSEQAKRRRRLTHQIKQSCTNKQSWRERDCVHGYRKIHQDLLNLRESCAPNTVAKLMRDEGLRAQVGHKRLTGKPRTKPAIVAAHCLQQDFNIGAPDAAEVTDITYVRTY
ncbi:MAG: IS3 family transposase [Litorimonas sp.]